MSADWLTAEKIERDYGILKSSLELWRTYGCIALNGAKPRAKRDPGPRSPNLYHRGDIEAIASVPATHGRFRHNGATWVDGSVAQAEFGIPRERLSVYRKRGCRLLGGRKIRGRKVLTVARGGPNGVRLSRVWFYLESELVLITEAMSGSTAPSKERGWLTIGEARDRFGFSKHALLHWRNDGCVHLGGRKLTAKKIRTEIPNQAGERTYWGYCLAELKAIAERQASPPPVDFSDDEGEWLTAATIQNTHGVPARVLSYWRSKRRPRSRGCGVRCKQIPTPPSKPTGKAHDRIWVYHAADVLRALSLPDGRTREARRLQAARTRQAAPADPPPTKRSRQRRAAAYHSDWEKRHSAGESYETIARAASRELGRRVSAQTVRSAIRRRRRARRGAGAPV